MIKYLLAFTWQLLLIFSVQAQKDFSRTEIQEDIRLLRHALKEIHPAPYTYLALDSFEQTFKQLIKNTPESLSRREALRYILPTVRSMRCAHTGIKNTNVISVGKFIRINIARKNKSPKYLPFVLFNYQDTIKVIERDSSKHGKLLGNLVSINGKDSQTLIDTLNPYFHLDGFVNSKDYFLTYLLNTFYNRTFQSELKKDIQVVVEQQKRVDSLRFVASEVSKPFVRERFNDNEFWKWKPLKGQEKIHEEAYRLYYTDSLKQTALLRITSFRSDKKGKQLSQIFQPLQSDTIKHFIIDLQDNTGGSLVTATRLLQYLLADSCSYYIDKKIQNIPSIGHLEKGWYKMKYTQKGEKKLIRDLQEVSHHEKVGKRNKFTTIPIKNNHFDGKIYVLVNGLSASASSFTASFLQDKKRATIVGTETGGGASLFFGGHYASIELPNTKLLLRIPLYELDFNVHSDNYGRGVIPDIIVQPTLEDLYERKNEALEEVLKIIRSSSLENKP